MQRALIEKASAYGFDNKDSHGIISKGSSFFVCSFPPSSKYPELVCGRVEIWRSFRLTPEIMGETRTLEPNECLSKNKRSLLVFIDAMGPLHAEMLRNALTQVIETSEIKYSEVPDPE